MNTKKVFLGMCGVVTLLSLGLIAATYYGNSFLQQKSASLVSLKLDNQVLDAQQTAVTQAKKDIKKYTGLEEIAKSVVPQEKDQAETVREIVNIAAASGIKLGTISFPASTLGETVPSSASGTTSKAPVSPSLTQVVPVSNIPGLYVMEINIQQDTNSPVSFDRFIDFLSRLEQNRRTAQVMGVTVQPNPQNRSLITFNLVLNVYIKP